MKTNRDYPLSSTPKPKANGELDTLINKASAKLKRAIAQDQSTPYNVSAKKQRQEAVNKAEEEYVSLVKMKKGK